MMAAPAVWIRVLEVVAVPQPAACFQRLFDAWIRVEDLLPGKQLHRVEEVPGRADRRIDVEAVAHAGDEVVSAVTWRGVHRTGPRFERHVVAEHRQRGAGIQGMLEPDVL